MPKKTTPEQIGIESISPEAWEKTFSAQATPLAQDGFESIVRQAAATDGVELSTSLEDTHDAIEVVRKVLAMWEIGSIGLCFPASTFGGDEIAVSISRFPGKTVVGLLHSWWGPEPSIVFVLAKPSLKAVRVAAENAIVEAYDCSEWSFFDQGEDISQNDSDRAPAQWFGYVELRGKWKQESKRRTE